ncbi:MAG TPA: L-ribulose-5-phosphate 4-epimerase AraD [Solirubrobacteraceae bacterium]|jgi:L-ribulose-5-phosphate 4-epimerase
MREAVLAANLALPAHRLVTLTWGNVSGIDRERGLVAIKPSGVPYETMMPEDIVLVDLDGNVVEGQRRPSTDTPTHLELYRAYDSIGGIVHTHSPWATAWAQAEREIPLLGTTHADLSDRPIALTRPLTESEVEDGYETATGRALVDATSQHDSCALVRGHGPFAWGASPAAAVEVAVTLEQVARLALLTTALAPDAAPLAEAIRRKHFERKHGARAYYGQ